MKHISKTNRPSKRDFFFYRRRLQSSIYHAFLRRFAELAEKEGLTKKELASEIEMDAGQLSRLFRSPGNWKLDTISDLLLGMGAELRVVVSPMNISRQPAVPFQVNDYCVTFDRVIDSAAPENTATRTKPAQPILAEGHA